MYNISHLSRCTHHIKIELNSDYDDDGSAYSLMLMMTTMIMEYFICYIWVRYMLQKSVKQNKILGYLSVSAWKYDEFFFIFGKLLNWNGFGFWANRYNFGLTWCTISAFNFVYTLQMKESSVQRLWASSKWIAL